MESLLGVITRQTNEIAQPSETRRRERSLSSLLLDSGAKIWPHGSDRLCARAPGCGWRAVLESHDVLHVLQGCAVGRREVELLAHREHVEGLGTETLAAQPCLTWREEFRVVDAHKDDRLIVR